jgi:pimeloyl-ACP methyl ester carboxylesterase
MNVPACVQRPVELRLDGATLGGELALPENAVGLVMFAHGSGSSRLSPRNQHVATELRGGGLGTLLFDLLSAREEEADERTGHLRFDVELLARRVVAATEWLAGQPEALGLPVGYFGASTGAAAALIAAAERPAAVAAVVSRGGRPDLAADSLARVQAPTLLIVGGSDTPVVRMNAWALEQLSSRVPRRLEIVPGAGHLFEEPGALDHVARLALDWFLHYLPPGARQEAGT